MKLNSKDDESKGFGISFGKREIRRCSLCFCFCPLFSASPFLFKPSTQTTSLYVQFFSPATAQKASPKRHFRKHLQTTNFHHQTKRKGAGKAKERQKRKAFSMIPLTSPAQPSPINSSKTFIPCSTLSSAPRFDFLAFSPMESFALLKFWKTSTAKVSGYGDPAPDGMVPVVEEEEDSFFELELQKSEMKIGRIGDFISDEEPDARIKPQSPMSILAPKLRVFMQLMKKSKPEKAPEADAKPKKKLNFTVKLRIMERRNSNEKEVEVSCRRFSKDSVNKYLNLIIKKPGKPLDCAASTFMSPRKSEDRRNSRFQAPCKKLRKSRSAGASPVGWRAAAEDDSLAQQMDGIQGAILHCKQSLNASPHTDRLEIRQ